MSRHSLCFLAVAFAFGLAAPAGAQVAFREDFEGPNPRVMQFWATNVPHVTVHTAAVSEERAYRGRRSFKLDVTLTSGSYYYWWLPVRIPFWTPLKVRGRLFCAQNRALLGFGYGLPSTGISGNVQVGKKIGQEESGWEEFEVDASSYVGMSDTAYIEGIAIFIYPPAGSFQNTRVTLYVDELEVLGALPADYEKQLDRKLASIRRAEKQATLRRSQRLQGWAKEVIKLYARKRLALPARWGEVQQRLETYYRRAMPQVLADSAALRKVPDDSAAIERLANSLPLLDKAVRSLAALPVYARQTPDSSCLIYAVPAIQDLRILPDSFPVAGVIGKTIRASAARGEITCASFAVTALQDWKKVRVTVSPLRLAGMKSRLTALPEVDVRVVKVWWQAGVGIGDVNHPTLTPELLLHDDSFVRVDPDPKTHRNTLKDPAAPRDATSLQPLDIAAKTTRQFWLTIRVPEKAKPGMYRADVVLASTNARPARLNLQLEVYPFVLAEPKFEYAIYYRGTLSSDDKPTIGSEQKSERQYRAELRNMREHGVVLPTCYTGFGRQADGTFDFLALKRSMEIYRQEGLTQGPIIVMGAVPFYEYVQTSDENKRRQLLEETRQAILALNAFRKANGFPPMAVYGIDEASGETLWAEREVFRTVVEAGGMTAVACGGDFWPAVGKWLSRPILNVGAPETYPKVHAAGNKVWVYNRPMSGVEMPETHRRSYGLMLWKRGEDGVCNYAYQHAFGASIYDDFDDVNYRDHVYAYPTVDGVIDTVQWEGVREGVNDLRYLTTLLRAIDEAKGRLHAQDTVRAAQSWLDSVDIEGDLHTVRRRMAQWIIQLEQGIVRNVAVKGSQGR
jgi:hypothetical protein